MAKANKIVVLTGAGISAESGIQTFRAADGLWENHRIEDVATPEAFKRDPQLVHQFYNSRRRQLLSGIEPNAAHRALAELGRHYDERLTLITQNIDDLHQRCGSVCLAMHGELLYIRCKKTGQLFESSKDSTVDDLCPCCSEAGNLRPHVVWFGEMPLFMAEIDAALQTCDLFIAIGTSGHVYPAAGFCQTAKYHGAHTVELNLEPSQIASAFDEQHYGPASDLVPRFLSSLM